MVGVAHSRDLEVFRTPCRDDRLHGGMERVKQVIHCELSYLDISRKKLARVSRSRS